MIQAINSVNTNSYKKQNASFKQQGMQQQLGAIYKPPSKAKRIATYLGTQFVAGAIFSAVWDAGLNAFKAIKKTPMISLKEIASRSVMVGALFTLVGAVFAGIDTILAKKRAKNLNPMV